MKIFTDPVAAVFLDQSIARCICDVVDDVSDLPEGHVGATGRDGCARGVNRRLHESLAFRIHVAAEEHPGTVPVVRVDVARDVDVNDVAIFQWPRIRNTVADDLIDRCGDGLAEAAVAQGRRIRPQFYDFFVTLPVNVFRGDTRLVRDMRKTGDARRIDQNGY